MTTATLERPSTPGIYTLTIPARDFKLGLKHALEARMVKSRGHHVFAHLEVAYGPDALRFSGSDGFRAHFAQFGDRNYTVSPDEWRRLSRLNDDEGKQAVLEYVRNLEPTS